MLHSVWVVSSATDWVREVAVTYQHDNGMTDQHNIAICWPTGLWSVWVESGAMFVDFPRMAVNVAVAVRVQSMQVLLGRRLSL
jgi:hypothetical protein